MSAPETFVLCLYVAGNAPNSSRAVANLRTLCQQHLGEGCQVEIIDVLIEPQRLFTDQILVTPTLVKRTPTPSVRIIGDLSETEIVLRALGIDPTE